MKKQRLIFWITGIIIYSARLHGADLRVAAAANVQHALSDIVKVFQKNDGTKVDLIFASSGKLTAQIKNGAPYDIFISADNAYPFSLYSEGLALQPRVYALGSLVLWTMGQLDVHRGFEVLAEDDTEKISIPNPELAPYGRAAMQAIRKTAFSEIIIKKLVYAESVTQSNQYIQTASVDVGFTSLSSALDSDINHRGKFWIIDASMHSPIEQSACILEYGKKNHRAMAEKFFRFLFSKEAEKIFLKYGYKIPHYE